MTGFAGQAPLVSFTGRAPLLFWIQPLGIKPLPAFPAISDIYCCLYLGSRLVGLGIGRVELSGEDGMVGWLGIWRAVLFREGGMVACFYCSR